MSSISDIAGVKGDSPLAKALADVDPAQSEGSSDAAETATEDATANPKWVTEGSVVPATTSTTLTEPSAQPTENSTEQPASPSPVTESTDTSKTVADNFVDALFTKATPAGAIKERPPLRMMVFSDPGVGKTLFSGQIPNNFIIDTEQGRITLDSNAADVPDSTLIYPYRDFQALDMIIDNFINNPDERLKQFKVLTLDTLSTLHKKGLAEVVMREHRRAPKLVNEFNPETEHHGENNERIRRILERIKNYEGSLIINCHARSIERKGHPTKIIPDFSEKLANTLSGMVDMVGYLYIANLEDGPHRVMRCTPSETVYAKNRLNLPDNIIDPTWDKIYEAAGF